MNIMKKMSLDLYRRGVPERIELVRGDSAVSLQISLSCDGSPWEIPKGASVLLRYRNGLSGGEYDTLPDGSIAYAVSGNVLTVHLAPAVCSMAGDTDLQAVIYVESSQKSTLRIPLFVQGEVSGSREPESYTNLTQWLSKYGGSGGGGGLPDGALTEIEARIDGLQENKADEKIPIDATGKIVQDCFIRAEDGQQRAVTGERCTDFIPVEPGIGLLQAENLALAGSRAFWFYDSNKEALQCAKTGSADTTVTVEVPADAAYFRTSIDPVKSPVFSYVQIITRQFQDVNDKVAATRQQMNTSYERLTERIHPQTPPIDLSDKIIENRFIREDGTEGTQEGERCTDFVPVTGGYRLRLTGVKLVSARSLCVYDGDKNFLRRLYGNTDETDITVSLPENAAYFRTCVHPTETPAANYIDILGTVEENLNDRGNYILECVKTISPCAAPIDLSDYLLSDHFIRADGTQGSQEGERCTDFVPVAGGYSVHFTNLQLNGGRAFVVYDGEKQKLSTLLTGSSITETTLTMPENAAYFRTSVHPTETPKCSYLPLLQQVEERLLARITALENRVGNG